MRYARWEALWWVFVVLWLSACAREGSGPPMEILLSPSPLRAGGTMAVTLSPVGGSPTPTRGAMIGSATPSVSMPSPTPLAPSASPTASGPVLESFQADREAVRPGEAFTLTWSSPQAAQAWLYRLVEGRLAQGWPVSPTASLVFTAPSDLRQPLMFMLFVFDASGAFAARSLTLSLRECPDPWFFPNAPHECPSGPPLSSFAAEQPFQRGHMIWIQALDWIFVLFADERIPRWQTFPDQFEEGMPELDPSLTPPAGLFQPIRGFGLVWRTNAEVRERLGWAIRPERGFTAQVQHTARERYNVWFIQAPDGGLWRLEPEGSGWSYQP